MMDLFGPASRVLQSSPAAYGPPDPTRGARMWPPVAGRRWT